MGAQEITLLGGVSEDSDTHDRSNSWQIEYMEGLGNYFAITISHLNEGHIPNHHRDGNAIQLWGSTGLIDRRIVLAAGVGPYFFYDTIEARAGRSYSDSHGWGYISSMAVTWYTESRLIVQFRTNWVHTSNDLDTITPLIGLGYRFDVPARRETGAAAPTHIEKST
ncbi:MAG TPA: hypothetical protein VMU10_08700 [Desulfomonilia bacterium]|nr:hypothetical protein [Desulfomonilia bacterium]